MLSSRKRSASQEKNPENSKIKKLKVSNKIFCSPASSKPNSLAKIKIYNLLPEDYESIILTANTKAEENGDGNETIFGCVRLPIITKEDALIWVKKFERKTFTSYRTQRTWKSDPNTGLFKKKFLCTHCAPNEPDGVNSCKACIIFTIKDAKEIQTNPDYYLRDFPAQVIIQFCHNHKIEPDVYLKNLRPSAELRVIFSTYFARGHSPFSALTCHKCDLHSSYGAEFYDVVSNGAICPSYNWCYREFEKLFMRKFVEPQEDELIERLGESVIQFNANCRSDCAVFTNDPSLVLTICTPLMKSVFRSGFAEDLITVRNFCTPKTMPKRQKLILFLCHTPIGSLPFGVVLTSAEDKNAICDAIKTLLTLLGVSSYSPKTIISDENSLISNCLEKSFPKSRILFNEFLMLQSIWRILRLVCEDDNDEFQILYNLFSVTLNSDSEEDFKRNFDSLLVYAEKYPKLTSFLKYFKLRSNSYVLFARPKVEFSTDVLNYTDSGTIILQDVSIKYANFFNILQLFDFLTNSYVNHYEKKLVKIVEGDLKGFFKTNFYVPLSKIADFTCEKVSDTEFLVRLNDVKFFVNAELDTCTCQVGVHGGSCVHQYIVEKNIGLVPECYTPLGEEMLSVFQSILSYKDTKHKELNSALDFVTSDLESFTDEDDFNPSGSYDKATIINAAQDVDNLGPLDEIYLVPSEVADSFTDEDINPLDLSEYEDSNEDNDELLNDTGQYNRESGELEHVHMTNTHKNALADVFSSCLKKSSDTETEKVIVYGYVDNDTECHNEEDVPIDEFNIAHKTVTTFPHENEEQIYEEVMTENDKKTAEIAEFLTNLPDTNNSHMNAPTATDPAVSVSLNESDPNGDTEEASDIIKQFQQRISPAQQAEVVPEGVVVMNSDEFFTQYRVMENGVLSIVTDTDDEYANQINTFQTATAQNFMGDSYEESNLIMMSPTDLFDDNDNIGSTNADSRINILSSVVIKPSTGVIKSGTIIPKTPLNLNTIKHKTLRNVKEDSRNRMGVSKVTNTGNNVPTTAPKKQSEEQALSDTNLKLDSDKNNKDTASVSQDQEIAQMDEECEKDVIQLYCYQSAGKSPAEQIPIENTASETEDIVPDEILEELTFQSETDSQEETEEVCEFMNLTECDPAQLAEESIAVAEIDSDDLEELASQEHDKSLVSTSWTQKSPLKMIPLNTLPLKLSPLKKDLPLTRSSPTTKTISLREFMSQQTPPIKLLVDKSQNLSDKKEEKPDKCSKKVIEAKEKSQIISDDKDAFLECQLTTAFSHLTDLASKNDFKQSVEKFLGKFKKLGTGEKLISALESFGSDLPSDKSENQLPTKKEIDTQSSGQTIKPKLQESKNPQVVNLDIKPLEGAECESESSISAEDNSMNSSDSDEFDSTEFEHFSDCRTSCSEFHSELEYKLGFSDYDLDDLQSSNYEGFDEDQGSSNASTKSTIPNAEDKPTRKQVNRNKLTASKINPKFGAHEASSDSSDGVISRLTKADYKSKNFRANKGKSIKKRFRYIGEDSDSSDEPGPKHLQPGFSQTNNEATRNRDWSAEGLKPHPLSLTRNEARNEGALCNNSPGIVTDKNPNSLKKASIIKCEMGRGVSIVKLFGTRKAFKQSNLSDNLPVFKNGATSPSLTGKKQSILSAKEPIQSKPRSLVTQGSPMQAVMKSPVLKQGIQFVKAPTQPKPLSLVRQESPMQVVMKSLNVQKQGIKFAKKTAQPKPRSWVTQESPTDAVMKSPVVHKQGIKFAKKNTQPKPRSLVTQESPKQAVMTNDAKQLESILMDGVENESDVIENSQEQREKSNGTSIVENEELSFLFNDPRFETTVDDSEDVADRSKEPPSPQQPPQPRMVNIFPHIIGSQTLFLLNQTDSLNLITTSNAQTEILFQNKKYILSNAILDKPPSMSKPMARQIEVLRKPTTEKQLAPRSRVKTDMLSMSNDSKNKVKNKNKMEETPKFKPPSISKPMAREIKGVKKTTTGKILAPSSRVKAERISMPKSDDSENKVKNKNKMQETSEFQGISESDITDSEEEEEKEWLPGRGKLIDVAIGRNKVKRPRRNSRGGNISNKMATYTTIKGKNPVEVIKVGNKPSRSDKSKIKCNDTLPLNLKHKDTLGKRQRKNAGTSKNARKKRDEETAEPINYYSLPHKKGTTVKIETAKERGKYNRRNISSSVGKSPFLRTATRHSKHILESNDNISRRNDSLDFENSISASVLKKSSKELVTSTPLRPVGYEDAFRRFLETSDDFHGPKKSKSFSDYEDYREESDSESNTGGKRRAKSVCSLKRLKSNLGSKTPDSAKIKKSVSWADGMNIIEYMKESGSDSDSSEVLMTPQKPLRKKRLFKKTSKSNSSDNKKDKKVFGQFSMISPAKQRRCSKEYIARGQRLNRASSKRTKSPKLELIVLIERNIEVELMCQSLKKQSPLLPRPVRGRRRGYKELLESAQRLKYSEM